MSASADKLNGCVLSTESWQKWTNYCRVQGTVGVSSVKGFRVRANDRRLTLETGSAETSADIFD